MSKKRRFHRSNKFEVHIAPIAGLAVGLRTPAESMLTGDWQGAIHNLAANYTGFDTNTGKFNWQYLMGGTLPLAAGLLVHKFIGGAPLNANRMLASAGIPFIRI